MQKGLSSIKRKIRSWIKGNKAVDVVLFGSYIRGRTEPSDVDFCIIINKEDEKRSIDLIDSLGRLLDKEKLKSHVNAITAESFVSGNTLGRTLLCEGYSIKRDSPLSSLLGYESRSIFEYSLKEFSPSKRVRFHYLLRGRRGQAGILKENKGKFMGTGTIIVPVEREDIIKEIFDAWHVRYRIHKVLIS